LTTRMIVCNNVAETRDKQRRSAES